MTDASVIIPEVCEIEPEDLCPEAVALDTRRAIFPFRTVPRFTQFWQNYSRFIEEVNGPTHYNAGITPLSGTAWYTPEGLVASRTFFTNVLSLSSLVLTFSLPLAYTPGTNAPANRLFNAFKNAHVDPNPTTPTVNRYSDLPGFMDLLRDVCNGGCIASYFDFYVELTAPNGCSFSYRAQLMGCEFETGLALYKIRNGDPWNKYLNPVGRQDVLEWGVSREAAAGSPVYCQYNSRVSGANTFSAGVVSKARTTMSDGSITVECLMADLNVDHGAEGAPLLNAAKQVIGQVIGITEHGKAVAVASSFLLRIYNELVKAICSNNCTCMVSKLDAFGCYVYQHGSLGRICYHKISAIDVNQTLLVHALGVNECGNCGSSDPSGSGCGCGSGDAYWSNRDYVGSNERLYRRNLGVVLSQDPCGPIAETAEECVITDPNLSEQRRRFYMLRRGDVITHLDGIPIGDEDGERSIDDILFGLEQGCIVRVTFRKQAQKWNFEHYINVCLESSIAFVPTFRPVACPA